MLGEQILRLVEIMARLRSSQGCPWDREQDHQSLKPYLVEEAYEVLEAIENRDDQALREELGDLLLQVVFHAQLANEEGRFHLGEVVEGICEKLIRRHPHVFAGMEFQTSGEVLQNWKKIKAAEKGTPFEEKPPSIFDGLPGNMPALTEAHQISRRAARVGFDWPAVQDVFEKLAEEVGELKEAVQSQTPARAREELGDLLFVVVNLARQLGADPDLALRQANQKFMRRFRFMEEKIARQGGKLEQSSLEEMETLWQQAKQEEH